MNLRGCLRGCRAVWALRQSSHRPSRPPSRGPVRAPFAGARERCVARKVSNNRSKVFVWMSSLRKSLTVGHRVPRRQAKEGAEAVAVGELKARGVIGQTVEALQHEHLEREQGMKARPATGTFIKGVPKAATARVCTNSSKSPGSPKGRKLATLWSASTLGSAPPFARVWRRRRVSGSAL
jgi:hypothetical protein